MAKVKRQAQANADTRLGAITLGQLIEHGVPVFCWCNRCAHHATLDAQVLAARLGPRYAVPEIGAQMRCSGCGAKDVATRPVWPSLGTVAGHTETV